MRLPGLFSKVPRFLTILIPVERAMISGPGIRILPVSMQHLRSLKAAQVYYI